MRTWRTLFGWAMFRGLQKRRARRRMRRNLGFLEQLEDRTLLAAVSGMDGTLTIELAANESLSVVSNGASYSFTSTANFTNGGVASAGHFSGFASMSLTLNSDGLAQYNTISIIDAGSGARVTFNDSGTNAYSDNFVITLDNNTANGANAGLTFNGATSFTGSAGLTADIDTRIAFNTGSSLTTINGDLTLRANQKAATTSGNFVGIHVNGSVVSTGNGAITLTGRGGDTGDFNLGVAVNGGGQVIGGAGTLSVTGQGGSRTSAGSNNYGVFVDGASITSTGGNISVDGSGGGGLTGTGVQNYGVSLGGNSKIAGAGQADVIVLGQGGRGSDLNMGVLLYAASAEITSEQGNLTVTGTGGDGHFSHGVRIAGGRIESAATGSTPATLSVTGHKSGDAAIRLDGTSSLIRSAGAAMFVNAVDGDLQMRNSSQILSNEPTAGTGRITLSSTNNVLLGSVNANESGTGLGGTVVVIADSDNNGSGAIIDNLGAFLDPPDNLIEAPNIIAANVALIAGNGIGATDNDINLQTAGSGPLTLAARTTSGAIQLHNQGNLTLGTVTTATSPAATLSGATITNAAGAGNIAITAVGTLAIGPNTAVTTTGSRALALTATRNILLQSGSSLSTVNGGITLSANAAGTASGNFIGIAANNATISTTGTGHISLTGRGGDSGSQNHGISLHSGASITSTAAGTNAGKITLDGVGGNGTSHNYGVFLSGTTTDITSFDGDISITGQGGGTSSNNYGIYANTIQTIASTGTGDDAAKITLNGTGGNGTSYNVGVLLFGNSTGITSVDGDISITGGEGGGFESTGLNLQSWAQIGGETTGADITLITNTIDLQSGTSVQSTGALVIKPRTAGTSIGLGNSAAGTLNLDASELARLIDGFSSITIGDLVHTSTVDVRSYTLLDPLNIRGTTINVNGTLTGGNNALSLEARRNIALNSGSSLTTVNGGITLSANAAGTATGFFRGIEATGAMLTTTGTGNISLTGTGGDTSQYNHGILLVGTTIASTATGEFAGTITLDGAGGNGSNRSVGVQLDGDFAPVLITSVDGAITITGQGGTGGDGGNAGVELFGTTISSTGSGEHAATITIDGSGGSGSSANMGVNASGGLAPVLVTSVDGAISIIGQGGTGGIGNYGVLLQDFVTVSSTGSGEHAATIEIDGAGGSGPDNNIGVRVRFSQVTSIDGDITVSGEGGQGTGTDNQGVLLDGWTVLSSTGMGTDAATIKIDGAAGTGTTGNHGVLIQHTNTRVTSVAGDIEITGAGKGTAGHGVYFHSSVTLAIQATGDANVTIDGAGSGAPGVRIDSSIQSADGDVTIDSADDVSFGATSSITSADGQITVTAATITVGTNADLVTTGAGAISLTATRNILLQSGSSLTTVNGGITLSANAAGTTPGNFAGIAANNATISTTGTGNISLTGRGGNSGSENHGIHLHSGASITSTAAGTNAGKITLDGTGGNGTYGNVGVFLEGSTTDIASVDGDISLTGQGGGNGTNTDNYGILLSGIEKISSTGTGEQAAKIRLDGAGGNGTSSNHGVYLWGFTTDVTSADGDISIIGQGGGNGTSGNNYGIWLVSIETISSTGTGEHAATIRLDGAGGNGTSGNVGVLLEGSTTDITSSSGDISITGQGGGNGMGSFNDGILLDGIEKISSTGTGEHAAKITLDGTGGSGIGSNGVYLLGATTNIASVAGAIEITGAEGTDSGSTGLLLSSSARIGGATTAANITLITNTIDLQSGTSVQSTGALVIKPRTAGTTIGLGNSAAGTLNLTADELAVLQDGFSSITIGDTESGTGHVHVTAAMFQDNTTLVGGSVEIGPFINADANLLTLIARTGTISSAAGVPDHQPFITAGTLTLNGILAPGASPGQLSVSANVTLATGPYRVELNGSAVGTGYDQLFVMGQSRLINLNGVPLEVTLDFTPPIGTVFKIIDSAESSSLPQGTFAGLPEGAVFKVDNSYFQISYKGGDGNDVTLRTRAAPGIVIVESGGSTNVTEGGATDSYTIALDAAPNGEVEITVTADAQTEVRLNDTDWSDFVVLTFTSTTAQTVHVRAKDDNVYEAAHSGTITHAITASDSAFYEKGPLANEVTVNITDNDVAGVTITGGPLSVTEGGAAGQYTVQLDTVPTGSVQITVTADAQTQVSLNGEDWSDSVILTFTTANALNPQTVHVRAIDDNVAEPGHTGTISHAITSSGDAFGYPISLSIPSVTVNITDNDVAGVTITAANPIQVAEGGAAATYTIQLDSDPAGPVTIRISADSQTLVSLNGVNFFTTVDLIVSDSAVYTIHVLAVDDSDYEGPHASVITHQIFATEDAFGYPTSLALPNIQVAIADNDSLPPVLKSFGTKTVTHKEGAAPRILSTGVKLTDPDTKIFNGGQIVVTISANAEATDRLTIRNQGTKARKIGVAGSSITYGGVVIGTFTGGAGNTPLTISLNNNATTAAVQALLRNIGFSTVSDNPSTLLRTVAVQVFDGGGGVSNLVQKTVKVIPTNDRPVIGNFGGNLSYTLGQPPLAIAGSASIFDPDLPLNFNKGKLTVKLGKGAHAADRLNVDTSGSFSIDKKNLLFNNVGIGKITISKKSLTVTFNAQATPAIAQQLLRSVTYQNLGTTGYAPPAGNRLITATISDGQGGTSAAVSKQIFLSSP